MMALKMGSMSCEQIFTWTVSPFNLDFSSMLFLACDNALYFVLFPDPPSVDFSPTSHTHHPFLTVGTDHPQNLPGSYILTWASSQAVCAQQSITICSSNSAYTRKAVQGRLASCPISQRPLGCIVCIYKFLCLANT